MSLRALDSGSHHLFHSYRIRTSRPGDRIAVLHAVAPTDLLGAL